jgi:hypothetical protein
MLPETEWKAEPVVIASQSPVESLPAKKQPTVITTSKYIAKPLHPVIHVGRTKNPMKHGRQGEVTNPNDKRLKSNHINNTAYFPNTDPNDPYHTKLSDLQKRRVDHMLPIVSPEKKELDKAESKRAKALSHMSYCEWSGCEDKDRLFKHGLMFSFGDDDGVIHWFCSRECMAEWQIHNNYNEQKQVRFNVTN